MEEWHQSFCVLQQMKNHADLGGKTMRQEQGERKTQTLVLEKKCEPSRRFLGKALSQQLDLIRTKTHCGKDVGIDLIVAVISGIDIHSFIH